MYTSILASETAPRLRLFDGVEFAIVAAMLLLFTRVALPPLLVGLPEQYTTGEQSDPFALQMFYYLCYTVVAALIFRYIMPVTNLLFTRPILLIFVGYIVSLSLTSTVLSYSLSTAIEYGFATLFGVYLAVRFSYHQYMRMLAFVFIAILAISLAFVVVFPAIGLQQVGGDYALRGAFQNRNMLAYYMSVGAPLLLLYGLARTSRYSPVYFAASLVGFLCIYTSYALTAKIIVTAILFLIAGFSWAERSRLRRFLFVIISGYVGLVVITALSLYYSDILSFFGKDPTLTGRVAYFEAAIAEIVNSPIFGTHGAPFYIDFMGINNIPANAFSGHLNMLMFYGFVGLAMYIVLIVFHAVGAARFMRECPGPLRLWPMVFLGFWVFGNITESATLGVFFWALFCAHLTGFRTWLAPSST